MSAANPNDKRSHGLAKTWQVLAKTPNEAALSVLLPAIDSSQRVLQEGALRALLDRRSPLGQREVLKRLDQMGDRWLEIIRERPGRLSHAMRDGVLGQDAHQSANACQAILSFREYDLVSSLVTAAEDETNERRDLAAKTLLSLAQLLYEELSGPRDYSVRRDPQAVRNYVVGILQASVVKFSRHQRTEILLAFLILANRENSTLKHILQDPHHSSYLALVDGLLHGAQGGIVRLLLSFIDDPHSPSAAISVLAHRTDKKFIHNLLRKIGFEPAAAAMQNLKKIESIAWLRGDLSLLGDMDDAAQHSVVQMLMATSMKRADMYRVVEHLMLYGKPGGRRAAARALAEFNGVEANRLAMAALDDSDPRVQAIAVTQLRPRGIPGALSRLIETLNSPHEVVREAAREALAEFNFERYVAAYDMLDEEVRKSTGSLVKKVNGPCLDEFAAELAARSRTRRLRGISMALAMEVVPDLLAELRDMLHDEDHVVRSEAAQALATCDSPENRAALQEALHDRSVVVQEAAERGLRQLQAQSLRRGPAVELKS